MNKVKVGDLVVVLSGRDKGRKGKVLRRSRADRIFVEGINMVKKHMKPNPQKQQQGGIVERESSIHVSNIALINPATDKADKVGFRYLDNGLKVRYFKSNNDVVDV